MRQRPSALVAGPPVRPPAGTTAALGQVEPVAQRAAPEARSRLGQDEGEASSRPGQGGLDRTVRRPVLPERPASRRTARLARDCKVVPVDRLARRRSDSAPILALRSFAVLPEAATSLSSARPSIPAMGRRPEPLLSAVPRVASNTRAANAAVVGSNGPAVAVISALAVFKAVAVSNVAAEAVSAGPEVGAGFVADDDILKSRRSMAWAASLSLAQPRIGLHPLPQPRVSPRNAGPRVPATGMPWRAAVRGFTPPTLLSPLSRLGGEGRVRGAARTDAIRSKTARALRVALILIVFLATEHRLFLHDAVAAAPASVKQESFATPDDALKAVVDDLKANNLADLVKIFGPAIEPILNSGDPVAHQNARERFVAAAETDHRFDGSVDKLTLIIGKDDWPFPIPLKKVGERWQFDTAAGKEEILDRRIGENELSTIQTMLAYVDAQGDFAELQRQRSGTPEYAQRLLSIPGKMDGLYWPAQVGERESPLGPLVAAARAAGYRKSANSEEPRPYHGYFYKLLTAQGPGAPGGAVDYIVNGRMIGGFGLVAWPARYGDSGVMTFIVNHDDVVYQKNLGPQTGKLAPAISRFDPDPSWQKVQP